MYTVRVHIHREMIAIHGLSHMHRIATAQEESSPHPMGVSGQLARQRVAVIRNVTKCQPLLGLDLGHSKQKTHDQNKGQYKLFHAKPSLNPYLYLLYEYLIAVLSRHTYFMVVSSLSCPRMAATS